MKTIDLNTAPEGVEELLYSIEIVNEQVDSMESKKSFVCLEFETGKELRSVKCQLDIGATVNVIGYKNLKDIFKDKCNIQETNIVIKSFGNFKVKPLGETVVHVVVRGTKYALVFQVMNFDHLPMLSNNTCKTLGLVKVVTDCLEKNEDVFQIDNISTAEKIVADNNQLFKGLGKLNRTIKLQVKEDIIPSIQTPRRIPIHYREPLKSTLED